MAPIATRGLVLLCLSAALSSACEAPRPGMEASTSSVTVTQFADVPVPAGMTLRDSYHQSHSLQLGDYRYGDFLYTGSIGVETAASFMLERMPRHSWELVGSEKPNSFEQTLRFRRGSYWMECSLRKPDVLTEMRIKVRTAEEDPTQAEARR